MNILIVDDSEDKAAAIERAVTSSPGVSSPCVSRAADIVSAKRLLMSRAFDVLFVDLVVPNRVGEDPIREGGVKLLEEIKGNSAYQYPPFVVGITAYEDLAREVGPFFAENLFGLVEYDRTTTAWEVSIRNIIGHVNRFRTQSKQDSVDLAIVCALDKPELSNVLALPFSWEMDAPVSDPTVYHRGVMRNVRGANRRVVAAAAPQMGMPAMTAIAMKTICRYSPRYIAITGIAAGFRNHVNIGDVVVGDPCWDYGSGKYEKKGKGDVSFRADPRQLRLSALLRSQLGIVGSDATMGKIRADWLGVKPNTVSTLHIGPLASGAAVVAATEVGATVQSQSRKVVSLDMESYGVFMAAEHSPFPPPIALCIKGISDFGDEKKGDSFRDYAAYVSARVLYEWAVQYL